MLIVDTGPLLAATDTADPEHLRCLQLLESHPGPLITTALVIAETGWLTRRQLDIATEALLYRSIAAGQITVSTAPSPPAKSPHLNSSPHPPDQPHHP